MVCFIGNGLYDGPVLLRSDGEPEPELAVEWDLSYDLSMEAGRRYML